MKFRYASACLTAFALIAPSAIGTPKPVPAPMPTSTVPRPIPASALKTLLLTKEDLPSGAKLSREVMGSHAGEIRGVVFSDYPSSPPSSKAGCLWKLPTGSHGDGASVIVAVTLSPAEAARVMKDETHRYAGIFADMAGHTPLARFAQSVWYDDNGGNSFHWRKLPSGPWEAEAFDTQRIIHRGCIVFCLENVAVRIDIDDSAGYPPSDLFALGARVAKRIGAAAKSANRHRNP